MKLVALETSPPGVVTTILPVVAPVGTVNLIWVAVSEVIVTTFPGTFVAFSKLVPLTVTVAPTAPEAGVKLVIFGAGGYVEALCLETVHARRVVRVTPVVGGEAPVPDRGGLERRGRCARVVVRPCGVSVSGADQLRLEVHAVLRAFGPQT